MEDEFGASLMEALLKVSNSSERMAEHSERLVMIHEGVKELVEQVTTVRLSTTELDEESGTPIHDQRVPPADDALARLRFNYERLRGGLGHDRARPTTAGVEIADGERLIFHGQAAAHATWAVFWLGDRQTTMPLTLSASGRPSCPLVKDLVGQDVELKEANGNPVAIVGWQWTSSYGGES